LSTKDIEAFISFKYFTAFATEICINARFNFAMFVRGALLSSPVCSYTKWIDLHEICHWDLLIKYLQTLEYWLKSDISTGHFTRRLTARLEVNSLNVYLSKRNIFRTGDVEKHKTHVICSVNSSLCLMV
jgi:hypothetical protein